MDKRPSDQPSADKPRECSCPETTGGPFGTPGPVCMGSNLPGCRKVAEEAERLSARSAGTASTMDPYVRADIQSVLDMLDECLPDEMTAEGLSFHLPMTRSQWRSVRCGLLTATQGTPRSARTPITDEMVERALAAAKGAMVDTRRFWTDGDKAAVRAMLEAAL
jgi:hypothetical protein